MELKARGEGGCPATVQAVRTGGRAFAILLRGFIAGEEIQVVGRLKKKEEKASIRCEDKPLLLRATFAPKERGEVTYTAMGKSCSVTVSFKIGKDAVVPARRSWASPYATGSEWLSILGSETVSQDPRRSKPSSCGERKNVRRCHAVTEVSE
jgi:hypothetical protein